MANVTVECDIEVECNSCGRDLWVGAARKANRLFVESCVTCVSAAREEGRDEGIDEARAKAED